MRDMYAAVHLDLTAHFEQSVLTQTSLDTHLIL